MPRCNLKSERICRLYNAQRYLISDGHLMDALVMDLHFPLVMADDFFQAL